MTKLVVLDSAVLIDLERGISVLENFRVCVSVYISWWTRMELSNSSQTTSLEMLRVNYDSLRNRTVVQKWKDLRQLYVDYTEKVSIPLKWLNITYLTFRAKIQALHDQYPDFTVAVDATASHESPPESMSPSVEKWSPFRAIFNTRRHGQRKPTRPNGIVTRFFAKFGSLAQTR